MYEVAPDISRQHVPLYVSSLTVINLLEGKHFLSFSWFNGVYEADNVLMSGEGKDENVDIAS